MDETNLLYHLEEQIPSRICKPGTKRKTTNSERNNTSNLKINETPLQLLISIKCLNIPCSVNLL